MEDRFPLNGVDHSVNSTSQLALGVQGGFGCWLQLVCCASLVHCVWYSMPRDMSESRVESQGVSIEL